ncbi:glycosyltransferase family 8 protein [Alteromonas hispanica]|uniref:Glycosyltransferase family 8 protein n=1 Tax=Alteromonas hispanica TaxID=315421 RepID=A0A6L9MUK9_9ALTE|nr:glycosyltransferase family 8 protein [Alteromonas hispanica]NDW21615.1 hypothetical protein [Alteromonas hispanica]
MKRDLDVALCLDDNYVKPATAVIKTLQEHNPSLQKNVFVVYKQLSSDSLALLQSCCDALTHLVFKRADVSIKNVGPKNHVSSAAFIKIELVKVLEELDTVLYLDADMAVTGSLSELTDLNLDNYFLAAVENPFFKRHDELEVDKNFFYFNSGMMLLNLKFMRENDFYSKAHLVIRNEAKKLMFHDQDVFNIVADGKVLQLPIEFNFQTFYLRKIHKFDRLRRRGILSVYPNVKIMHYSSGIKPWKALDPHPAKDKFREFYSYPIINDYDITTSIKYAIRFLYVKLYYFIYLTLKL